MADSRQETEGNQGNNTGSTGQSTVKMQNAVIYDGLSEGPIEGLVNGAESIYLNGNPVQSPDDAAVYVNKYSNDVKYVASTGVVTDNQSKNIFTGLDTSDGTRWISIYGASKRANGIASGTAGQTIIETSSDFFANTDVYDYVMDRGIDPKIRIEGAGEGGQEYEGYISRYINVRAVAVQLPIPTTISGKDLCIDLVDTIASYSGSTCTLTTTGVGTDVANTFALVTAPKGIEGTVQKPQYNASNFGYAFRHGHRDQDYLITPDGIGTSSSAFGPNQELKQHKCIVAVAGATPIANPNFQ
jgi:hypothetical protein